MQVAVISLSSPKHAEPDAGFIGPGMLSAVSPDAGSLTAIVRAVTERQAALLILTEDQLAVVETLPISAVIVRETVPGGTVLIQKIAGAAAAARLDVSQVTAIAQAAADNLKTRGLFVSAVTSPLTGESGLALDDDEDGKVPAAILTPGELADYLVNELIAEMQLSPGDRIVALVNDLGGTYFEAPVVARAALRSVETRGISVERVYAGSFVRSYDRSGIALSLMGVDDQRLRYLDADTAAIAWPSFSAPAAGPLLVGPIFKQTPPPPHHPKFAVSTTHGERLRNLFGAACDSLTQHPQLALIASQLRDAIEFFPFDYPAAAFKLLAVSLQKFRVCAALFLRISSALDIDSTWRDAISYGVQSARNLTPTQPGDSDAFAIWLRAVQTIG